MGAILQILSPRNVETKRSKATITNTIHVAGARHVNFHAVPSISDSRPCYDEAYDYIEHFQVYIAPREIEFIRASANKSER